MPPVVPDPTKIRAFRSQTAFEAWLRIHHARETEVWLKIHKKASDLPSISGQRKSFDELSFLQRYTPRRKKSMWSQVNREHVARLIKAGRMTPAGRAKKIATLVAMLARGETIVPEARTVKP